MAMIFKKYSHISRLVVVSRSLSKRLSSTQSENALVLHKKLEGEDAGIAEVILNRDSKSLNVFNTPLLSGAIDAFAELKKDNKVRVVILRSNIPKAFSVGMDVTEGAFGNIVNMCHELLSTLSQFPRPIIAAIDGICLGGGFEVVLACDILVGSSNMRAGLVESKLGLIPGGGGHFNLAALVGPKRAKELIFTSEIVNGQKCHDIGIIQHLVEQNEDNNAAYLKAMKVARKIAPGPPLAHEKTKVLINSAHSLDFKNHHHQELYAYRSLEATEDAQEGIRHFINKLKGMPKFKGK